mgnify:CR=1 FL=1
MDYIAEFIKRYRREFDFYDQAARLVAQQLDGRLQASGIRAMVTSRAKNPRRLEEKVRQRASTRSYDSVQAIYDDIVDLAGVRVALYFPAERTEVGKIVQDQFTLAAPPKRFTGTSNPSYAKRFSGYWATHYRVHLREESLNEGVQRYVDARIEIQVASVMMHAWAEVEHDLVYKPLQGELSEDELAILDELNGMVLAGEIALERLQKAAEKKFAQADARFNNHYDLASFLFEATRRLQDTKGREPVLGDVDLLFRLLLELQITTPDGLRPYLAALHPDTERRPVAEQLIDQLVAANPSRYEVFTVIRTEERTSESPEKFYSSPEEANTRADAARTLDYFLVQWIAFETFLAELAVLRGLDPRGAAIPTPALLKSLQIFSSESLDKLERIRRLRNRLVHGLDRPSPEVIQDAANTIADILRELRTDSRPDVRQSAEKAFSGVHNQ